ncbi:MAG: AgmX/PglI C-terminal domain-containing protein [Candidatus Hatepunaea meridiana]|nr:AgmX/PglI C-terminal domain-containing protein [Candidatus Hatepunaea meridiana]
MAQVITFPREFERHFFRDLDYTFVIIWFIIFVIANSLVYYAQSIPVRQLTMEEVQKFNAAIYRIKKEKKPVERVVETQGGAEIPTEVEPEEEVVEEAPKEVTIEQKKAQRAAKKAARDVQRKAKMEKIASRIKILGGPTARRSGGRRSDASARAAVGLAASGGSADLKGALVVTSASDAAKVKKLRGGAALTEDIGDLDIGDLRGFLENPDNLSAMLKEASIKLTRRAITARGKGTKTRQRSQKAISDIILTNKNQVQYCYYMFKRRDSNLTGQVMVEFTIAPNGSIKRVKFRSSEWGGSPLGKDVEKCITNIIKQWHFEPIKKAEGNVTAGATYIFE